MTRKIALAMQFTGASSSGLRTRRFSFAPKGLAFGVGGFTARGFGIRGSGSQGVDVSG